MVKYLGRHVLLLCSSELVFFSQILLNRCILCDDFKAIEVGRLCPSLKVAILRGGGAISKELQVLTSENPRLSDGDAAYSPDCYCCVVLDDQTYIFWLLIEDSYLITSLLPQFIAND